jgi:acyl dehydratase
MPVTVGGPFFEDFHRGLVFAGAPGLTVTAAHAALHQAVAGDRLRLSLDAPLCRAVTGSERLLVHPNLVCGVAIGHSSEATHRVRANLFYRGLVLARPVFVGDTLRTRTEVVALRQNRSRPSGLAVLRIETVDAAGEPVLGFWRCPMVPLRDPDAQTGHADDLDAIPRELDPAAIAAAIPRNWDLRPLRDAAPGPQHKDLEPGTTFSVEGGETVTGAPELARATLNLAMVHTDATAAADGRRLVFGGHTISIAAAHATRAIPALATILAWESCDHLGPVHEGDVLRTELTIEGTADDGTARLRAVVSSGDGPVLDWRFVALVA